MDKKEEETEEDLGEYIHTEDGRVLTYKEWKKEYDKMWAALPEEEKRKRREEDEREERLMKLYLKHSRGIGDCLKDRIRLLVYERRLPSWENGSEELFEKAVWDYAAKKKLKHSDTDDLLHYLFAENNNFAREIWENVACVVEGEEGKEWEQYLAQKSSEKIKKVRREYYIPYRVRVGKKK